MGENRKGAVYVPGGRVSRLKERLDVLTEELVAHLNEDADRCRFSSYRGEEGMMVYADTQQLREADSEGDDMAAFSLKRYHGLPSKKWDWLEENGYPPYMLERTLLGYSPVKDRLDGEIELKWRTMDDLREDKSDWQVSR